MSAFAIQDGVVHHTYSAYARGVEVLMGTYQYLDLTPLGRDEDRLAFGAAWWRRHDEYGLPLSARPGSTLAAEQADAA